LYEKFYRHDSTISHVGFLLLTLSINSIESIQALIFYLTQYSLTSINIFFIIVLIGNSLKNVENQNSKYELLDSHHSPLQYISQLKGYYSHNPVLSVSFAVTIFSFVGIPPLIGFFAKQLVLSAALSNGIYFLSLIAILTSVVGGVYYLMLIKVMFFEESDSSLNDNPKNKNAVFSTVPSSSLTITISVLTLLNLLFILNPTILLSSANILAMIFLQV
jgi:NADH-ubiquinone oxidoreductase chain 2